MTYFPPCKNKIIPKKAVRFLWKLLEKLCLFVLGLPVGQLNKLLLCMRNITWNLYVLSRNNTNNAEATINKIIYERKKVC